MSKLHVLSKGTPHSTQVFDENGNDIEGVQKVEILISVGRGYNQVKLTLNNVELDVKGRGVKKLKARPRGGRRRRARKQS